LHDFLNISSISSSNFSSLLLHIFEYKYMYFNFSPKARQTAANDNRWTQSQRKIKLEIYHRKILELVTKVVNCPLIPLDPLPTKTPDRNRYLGVCWLIVWLIDRSIVDWLTPAQAFLTQREMSNLNNTSGPLSSIL